MSEPLWRPTQEEIQQTQMFQFMTHLNAALGTDFNDYAELHRWSVTHIPEFWDAWWQYADIIASEPYATVIDDVTRMPGAKWFSGARLNFAENLLRYRDDRAALIFYGEDKVRRELTYAQLFAETAQVAAGLKAAGVTVGDRVVGFMPNMPETIIAMLAAASLGATWSSCSPDFGIKGILDRFGQIQPKVLFTADAYWFKGRKIDSLDRVAQIVAAIDSLERVVVVPYVEAAPRFDAIPRAVPLDAFKASPGVTGIDFVQLPFDHPLYIMYSSGTTGLPKCMVQSAGGILVHHLKELILHTDLRREDVIFYFTTCGWMMWNWLTSSLAVGATVVLYDGNPFHPGPEALWRMAAETGSTVFGTSAGYLGALMASGLEPGRNFDLAPLRALLSTGSPLSEEGFEFVYRHIKADLQLASISGGTDLNGCFALGNPMAPVYAGELQCRGLAMHVEAWDESGNALTGEQGELVCRAPFPSMPLYFWNDPEGEKYRDAYFDVYPGVWRHGDFIEITPRGGVVIYGRSDATLNPGGVRIGTADIYRQLDQLASVEDSIVVGQAWKGDVRVVLFVKPAPGVAVDEELKQQIRQTIRQNTSPRHVPAKILSVADIPYTLNMKKVELAVRKVIHGQAVRNKDALKNPEALDLYADRPELQSD
ncbi:MAG: acetoacetate--CoA ligase [Desulfosarcinaceae bacterium]|nr:acetoacetate--CoA ligase [Desulfosarcinaceae bacterium]